MGYCASQCFIISQQNTEGLGSPLPAAAAAAAAAVAALGLGSSSPIALHAVAVAAGVAAVVAAAAAAELLVFVCLGLKIAGFTRIGPHNSRWGSHPHIRLVRGPTNPKP